MLNTKYLYVCIEEYYLKFVYVINILIKKYLSINQKIYQKFILVFKIFIQRELKLLPTQINLDVHQLKSYFHKIE